MASVKKVKQITIQLIEEAEAIAALEVLLNANRSIQFGKENFEFLLSYMVRNERTAILYEILLWSTYLFPEPRKYSATEVYRKYAECLSLTDQQPMKAVYPGVQFFTSWLSSKRRKNDAMLIDPTMSETVWIFKGFRYEVKRIYSDEEARLLILEDFDQERQRFENLKAKFDETPANETTYERPRIPEKVSIEVWRRDGGKCAKCGSQEKLEYDHIIPISKGGSNTARNIELLCEKHNRSKSNHII